MTPLFTHFFCFVLILALANKVAGINIGTEQLQTFVKNPAADAGFPGGIKFKQVMVGANDAEAVMQECLLFVIRNLYYTGQIVPGYRSVTLYVDPTASNIADNVYNPDLSTEIHLDASYVFNYRGDLVREIKGVLYHQMAVIWQWKSAGEPPGLISGIADYIRSIKGLASPRWKNPGAGYRWDQGNEITGDFLEYCADRIFAFVPKLNAAMRFDPYSNNIFVEVSGGKTVYVLWASYRHYYRTEL